MMNPTLQQFRAFGIDAKADATRGSNGTSGPSTSMDAPAAPRANGACDVCRRMKIKCDRTYPCSHCRESFNDCVFSQRRRRKRSPAQLDRIEHLEKRMKAVEESCQQRDVLTTASVPVGSAEVVDSRQGNLNDNSVLDTIGRVPNATLPSALENEGEARFLHSAAHMDFVRRLKDELGNWPGADAENRVRARNVPAPKLFTLGNGLGQPISLPPQDRARHLVNLAFSAHFLHNFIHRPTFDSVFPLLFTLKVSDYSGEEYRYLALLFSLMALGCLFEIDDEGSRDAYIVEGTQYFETCRSLADLQGCNDLVTLQAILYMNIFLLYTARISSSFSALSYTFSLALRMKYHQIAETDDAFTREDKKHVFWTTRHLLACVSITGGLPMPIGCDELDLEYPSVECESRHRPTETRSDSPHNVARWNPTVASVACFRLHNILGHVTKRLYPLKGVKKTHNPGPLRHLVSKDTVRGLESELRSWLASLPPYLRLGQEKHPLQIERAQYELCMSYAHAQIYLYRPFLHYLVTSSTGEIRSADGFPSYASACVDASRNIIRLAQDMYHRGLFHGVHWDISNMILAASLTMLYIILARKGSSIEDMALAELRTARDLMTLLEPYTTLAKRISIAVKLLTTAILPTGTRDLSPQNAVSSPSAQASDSHTTALAERTFRFVSRTNVSDNQGMLPGGRESDSMPVLATTGISAESLSQRPFPIASTEGSTSQGPPMLNAAQSSGASTSFPMQSDQAMYHTPFTSRDITEHNSLPSTLAQDYGIGGDDYGYMIDGTGPIDFSDMIGDLFASEGLL
ncbi:hypothetical protein F9C07_2281621 [Aspergillus flavus]|uniref:Zn(2)-C6 fungal-type domain-containing protein n=1 Tax=Aspergillus flavus (strain ATCC 200026 / FGSC A1120 / IAM 13836 / NRRL 3357 / JCM 12722 / SRRC 167) TaxID=332952 RepID=A0A7U2MKN5_ASPFN|nr:hypothetical protein AFLA_006753 [Aspergillus flavus NRRL3357]QRD85519.1 hypothetical protein F9C07_2281621 [Aspergillus flavus]